MKTGKFIHLLIFAIVVIVASSCSKNIKKPFISLPLPGFEKQPTVYSIDAQKGDSLKYTTGSVISIPPDALVDSAGNLIKGKVEIKYTEYHDGCDIFLAGIPLEYEAGTEKSQLVTAGMFDIRASQNGKQVFVANGKKIHVKMASFETGNDYDFFKLNEQAEKWDKLGTDTPQINIVKVNRIKEIKKQLPAFTVPFGKDYFVFDYNAILDVFFNDNSDLISQYEKSPLPADKAKSYGLKWYNIGASDMIPYKGVYYHSAMMVWKKLSKDEVPVWMQNAYCEQFVYLGDNSYHAIIKDNKNNTFVMKIEPIIPLKSLFAFKPEYWKNNYDAAMKEVEKQVEQLKFIADVYRNFDITAFGTHNWDKVYHRSDKIVVKGDFNLDQKSEIDELAMIYFIENNKSFIKFGRNIWDKIQLVPDTTSRIVAVIAPRTIAIFTNEQYRKINFDELRKTTNPSYSFKMESKKVASTEEVRKILGI